MKGRFLVILIVFGLILITAIPLLTTQPPVQTPAPMTPEEALNDYLSKNTQLSVNRVRIYNGSGTLKGKKVAYVTLNLRPGMDFFDAMQDAVDVIYAVFEGDPTIDVVRTSNVDKTEISERADGVKIEEVVWTDRETAMKVEGREDLTAEDVLNHFNLTEYTEVSPSH